MKKWPLCHFLIIDDELIGWPFCTKSESIKSGNFVSLSFYDMCPCTNSLVLVTYECLFTCKVNKWIMVSNLNQIQKGNAILFRKALLLEIMVWLLDFIQWNIEYFSMIQHSSFTARSHKIFQGLISKQIYQVEESFHFSFLSLNVKI